MKMAVASMEMAPGAIPRPGKVPEQRLLSPETEFRGGGARRCIREFRQLFYGLLRGGYLWSKGQLQKVPEAATRGLGAGQGFPFRADLSGLHRPHTNSDGDEPFV